MKRRLWQYWTFFSYTEVRYSTLFCYQRDWRSLLCFLGSKKSIGKLLPISKHWTKQICVWSAYKPNLCTIYWVAHGLICAKQLTDDRRFYRTHFWVDKASSEGHRTTTNIRPVCVTIPGSHLRFFFLCSFCLRFISDNDIYDSWRQRVIYKCLWLYSDYSRNIVKTTSQHLVHYSIYGFLNVLVTLTSS